MTQTKVIEKPDAKKPKTTLGKSWKDCCTINYRSFAGRGGDIMSDYKKISKFLENYNKDNGVTDYETLCEFLMQKNVKFPKRFMSEYDEEYGKGELREALGSDYAQFKSDFHLGI